MYTGSMYGAGPSEFALWAWIVIRATEDGFVDINPRIPAAEIGDKVSTIKGLLNKFLSPDPASSTKTSGGAKLERIGEYKYFIVNFAKYRDEQTKTARRKSNRDEQAVARAAARPAFKRPTLDDVIAHIAAKGFDIDAAAFHGYYETNGWVQGRNRSPIKSWKACLGTWVARQTRDKSIVAKAAEPAINHTAADVVAALREGLGNE